MMRSPDPFSPPLKEKQVNEDQVEPDFFADIGDNNEEMNATKKSKKTVKKKKKKKKKVNADLDPNEISQDNFRMNMA